MVATALLALVLALPGPPQSAPAPRPRAAAARTASKAEPELKQRGRQLLATAAGEVSGLSDPAMRGYAFLQLARAYAPLDPQQSLDLLNQAFAAAVSLPDDSKVKPRLQQEILEAMASANPQRVDELLPQAPAEARPAVLEALLAYYQKNKQLDRAGEIIDRMAAEGAFPYTAASKLMELLPPENAAERQRLFQRAIESTRSEKPPEGYAGPGGDFGALIMQHWRTLPAPQVRDAIDALLRQAEMTDSGSMEMTMVGQGGSLAFNSRLEWRLFQLLPALRQIDEAAATELLKKHQALEAQLQRYPQGLQSWRGDPEQPGVTATVVTTRDSSGPRQTPPAPPARVTKMLQMIEQMNQVLRDAREHPHDALALALAISDDTTRLRTLILLARATQKRNATVCHEALGKVVDQSDRVPLPEQLNVLVDASRLYLALSETDGLKSVAERGAGVAEKMYQADVNPDDPNKATKAYWPSTNAWTNFVRVAAQVSPDLAIKMVNEIPDEEIRPAVRIALAATWLGAPTGTSVILTETKAGARTLEGRSGE